MFSYETALLQKKRENIRIFPVCIFAKIQEITEKEKVEIR